MVKSPVEYFQEQDKTMPASSGRDVSPAERAFLKKYLGIDDVAALGGLAPIDGVAVADLALGAAHSAALREESRQEASPAEHEPARHEPAHTPEETPAGEKAGPPDVSVDEILRAQETVTLVGFHLRGDVFVIPINVVLEVIRYEEPFKLPKAPSFMPGVVNLRGRILPVINLAELLLLDGGRNSGAGEKNEVIIICEGRGMQVGLLIDKLHTMFKAGQGEINWNAEAHLGASAELLSGLLETGEKLLGIVSIERLVDKLLEA
jgi:purine-binding chemotaxis protein CheW